PADLSDADAPDSILREIAAQGRKVDILVNNAGFGVPQDFSHAPWGRHRDFLMVSVVNACALTYAAVPGMIAQRRGAVINVSSITAFSPGAAGHTLYPAAKSFALKFSLSLDAELREHGVRVTAVCPGFTRTEFHEASGMAALMEQAPRHFWTSAEAVADAAIAGNERGKVVVIPGWHNKLAAALMKYLPDSVVTPIIRAGAAKYRIGE
ncbi:MAG: SDR family NAD(P)-dependent oxidoreductase, partial [Alphaproteobacteria bacterium]|nr:SDR family NAD(P)-dependent oxidoreductase [Alphaproteobacteria bacterium]